MIKSNVSLKVNVYKLLPLLLMTRIPVEEKFPRIAVIGHGHHPVLE
jgi:hypothetical protein